MLKQRAAQAVAGGLPTQVCLRKEASALSSRQPGSCGDARLDTKEACFRAQILDPHACALARSMEQALLQLPFTA